ncbi:MAG: DUF1559 domain-containing protein [Planctomycetia bacterium]|nr:DUF1559 domain-containing protein [Planctomycetia bacterium]
MKRKFVAVWVLFFCVCFSLGRAQEGERVYEKAKPWITGGTTCILHLDLENLEPKQGFESGVELFRPLFPETLSTENNLTQAIDEIKSGLDVIEKKIGDIRKAGGRDFFLFVDLISPTAPVFAVVPLDTQDASAVAEAARIMEALPWTTREGQKAIDEDVVVAYYNDAIVILPALFPTDDKEGYAKSFFEARFRVENPLFLKGFSSAEDCSIKVVYVSNSFIQGALTTFKQFLEMGGDLALTIPNPSIITRGLETVALGIDWKKNTLKLDVYSRSEKAAANIINLYHLWREELVNIALESADENGGALQADTIDFWFEILKPTRDGAHIYWDFKENAAEYPIFFQNSGLPVGLLVGLIVPAVQEARDSARTMQFMNCYKQCGLAILNYEARHQKLPPAYSVDAEGKPLHSWRVLILPYLGEEELYRQIRLDEPWDSEWNQQFHDMCPAVFKDPRCSDAEPGDAMIAVVVGESTPFPPNGEQISIALVSDGTSNTVSLVQCEPMCWMDPASNVPYENAVLGPDMVEGGIVAGKNGETIVGMCDGSVWRIEEDQDFDWATGCNREDGEAF